MFSALSQQLQKQAKKKKNAHHALFMYTLILKSIGSLHKYPLFLNAPIWNLTQFNKKNQQCLNPNTTKGILSQIYLKFTL